ncbi:DNA cytosine methyltransferase [Qipengyuania sp. G39]|uniref:Cytosine-specific methyltransferase n=1 Tax=Qipengyuania profundimaris TaxID=3067652 RepID=A0ABT9HQN9_9SPHN|nr:DNA cytosine methyltransferase [Qipengyuania sp. G39]MDP4575451.1 DNA cytosine methyltransferase [Qipengyuania sp. G39]
MGRLRAAELFCGTGGFSRGAHEAGFDVVVAYDNEPNLTYSYTRNFPKTKLVPADISDLTGEKLVEDAGGSVDLIFGGPPCQGFSMIGKRDKNDPRRSLLKKFFEIVEEARPLAFVVENVEGLLMGAARDELNEALDLVPSYVISEPTVLDAADYGAATKRRRAFVVGLLCENPNHPPRQFDFADLAHLKKDPATVEDAISDLGSICKVDVEDDGTDVWRLRKNAASSDYAMKLHSPDRTLTGNKRTAHMEHVLKRFAKVKQGEFDPVGKYPRLKWGGQCPTLRAGTGADKGSHQAIRPIHPTEDRVITVREGARLQGFPDEHRFHPTIWHSFRQIGNSVSPIIAEAVLSAVHDRLTASQFAEAAE